METSTVSRSTAAGTFVDGSSNRDVSLRLRVFVVSPRGRLGPRDDPSDVWILFTRATRGLRRFSLLRLQPPRGLLLLFFLLRALTRAFALRRSRFLQRHS